MALTDPAKLKFRAALGEAEGKEVATAIDNAVVPVNASNLKFVGGTATPSNAATVDIVTGLTTVTGFSITEVIATAPTIDQITMSVSGGTVTAYFWKSTASGNSDLTAATTSGTFRWMAFGT